MLKTKNISIGEASLPFSAGAFPVVFRELLCMIEDEKWQQRYLLAALPCVASYADRLRANYFIDGEVHAPLFQVAVVGPQASGKGYLRRVNQLLMKKLEAADGEERMAVQRHNDLPAKEREKSPAPDACIRYLTSSPSQAFVQKMAGNQLKRYGDFLSVFYMSEEATLLARSNRSAWSNLEEIMRTGFDLGARFGNDRAYADASSLRVEVRLNMLYSTTPSGMSELFTNRQVEQGSASRVILVPIDDEIVARPAKMKQPSAEGKHRIDALLEALWDDTFASENELRPEHWEDMRWLFPTIESWCESQRKNAIEYQTRSYDSLYRRASVIGFRGAMLFSYLYHVDNRLFAKKTRSDRWIRSRVRELYTWLADYVLRTSYAYWGEQMEAAMKTGDFSGKKSKDLFSMLPEEFSTESLKYAMQKMGMKTEPKVRLSQWRSSHLILSEGNVHRKIS